MNCSGRKHILLIVRHPVGGIRTYFKYIYARDTLRQHRFTVIAPDSGFASLVEEVFGDSLADYIQAESSAIMIRKIWSCLRNGMVHLVHSHGFTAGVLTVAAGAYTNIPHLMTAHDVFQEKQFEGAIGKFRRGLLVQLLRRIDVIHTVSQDATDNLLEYIHGLDKSQLCLIPHGIDADRFFFAVPLNTKSRYDSDRVLVGFFGRFMSQKGFRYLVDAVEMIVRESMSSKRPLVLTFSEGGYIREDYAYIQERGLGDYFRKMPHVDDMPAVIKSVDMVIMPSLWEACGLLGMEALVAGVPIIGSSCIGLREVLRDTPASMVPPADARALAEAIAGEMNMPRKDEFMKYACTARQRFSLDRPAAELNELYTRMLESRVRI